MARKRMIDPGIWTDEGMAELSPRQQLLYIGLFSNADDDGRLKGSAASIRLILPTIYAGVDLAEVAADLEAVLHSMRQLVAYSVEGREYLAFRSYHTWQKIDRAYASTLPAPPDDSTNGQRRFDEPPPSARHSRARAKVSTEEEKIVQEKTEEPSAATAAARVHSAPKPDRPAQVIEAIQTAQVPLTFTPRDAAAVKRCGAPPQKIAAAYIAAFRAEWGADWLRENLSVHEVVNRLAGYDASLSGRGPRAPNGRARTGLRGPGGRQELTTAQLIVDSRQHDIACDANEELPPELRAEVEHLEAIGWRLSTGP